MKTPKQLNINSFGFRQKVITCLILFYILILISGLTFNVFAQDTLTKNKYIHYEGSLGQKKNMVLDLHKFGDSIFGTYYNQSDGQLHYFAGISNQQVGFMTTEKNGDSLNGKFVVPFKLQGYTCDREGKNKTNFSFSETDYFGSMKFFAYRNNRTYSFSDKPLYPPYKVDLMYLYPDYNMNKLVEDSVQDYIIGYYFGKNIVFNTSENMLKLLSDYFYRNYFAHYKTNAFDYRSSLLQWSNLQDIQILFNENFVLTFCIKQNVSNWLNKPNWEQIYFVINLKTGNLLSPDEIFIDGYKDKLRSLITEKIKKQFNITTSLQSDGFYKSIITKNDNFFVTREGIGFHYNPGDIAPWIFGEIDVFFRFDELKDILLSKGIIYTLVQ